MIARNFWQFAVAALFLAVGGLAAADVRPTAPADATEAVANPGEQIHYYTATIYAFDRNGNIVGATPYSTYAESDNQFEGLVHNAMNAFGRQLEAKGIKWMSMKAVGITKTPQ